MSSNFKSFVAPGAVSPMPEFKVGISAQPRNVRIYEITLSKATGTSPKEIKIEYSFYHEFPVGSHADFLTEMAKIVNDSNSHGSAAKRYKVNGKFAGSRMSVGFADPAKTGQISYLVFRLSDELDWSFNFNGVEAAPPFTMPIEDIADLCFFEVGKFNENGALFPQGVKPEALESCRYACFVVNGPNLPTTADDPNFERPFNIHVDLIEREKKAIINRIPIIIDPDVRNPGGGGG